MIHQTLSPDPAPVAVHNTLNGSQPDSCPFKRLRRVKPLEYAKKLIYVLHIESDSIVSNEHYHLMLFLVPASDFDFGLLSHACEFNSIRNQIDEGKP